MNVFPSKQNIVGFVAVLLASIGTATSIDAAVALQGQLVVRPLTPQEIKDYKLPATSDIASGLSTVPVGQAVHLEALVNLAIPAEQLISVEWSLREKPAASAAALEESPLGADVPTYSPADRLASRVAGRKLLRPDVSGQYSVDVAITTASETKTVTRNITAAKYMGVNTCALCHSGSTVVENIVAPWSATRHASMFTLGVDGIRSDHYSGRCISCHTVGFNANGPAVNGGFDDLAKNLGWEFPTNMVAGNWDAMPAKLKNLANIQCENCHGPGSEHAWSLGKTDRISISLNSGNCAQCHDSMTHHMRNAEWNNSGHAVTTRSPTGPGRSDCVRCHSGAAFVQKMSGATTLTTDYQSIDCATCHDPHDATNPHQLRTVADITLADGKTKITNAGLGAICMNCHMGRRDAVTYVETAALSAHFGPHYSAQADMLAGANGITYGKSIPSSAHRKIANTCVECHMQAIDATNPGFTHAGGHTFNMSWDRGTPDDKADDVHLVTACAECHGELTSFDIQRDDYDGDGVLEGAQTEVEGLLHELGMLLPPIGDPSVEITSAYTRQQARAAFNYKFVEEDGSHGVHNLPYAVGLLKASIADLLDDADKDGLSDKWEIAQFGSIQAQAAEMDSDTDGVSNSLELAAGTDPKLADSDADGYGDLVELRSGSDPLNQQDVPGLVVKMHTAAELEFASEIGKTYQIQGVSEITGAWQPLGDPVLGTGQMISRLTSTRVAEKAFYRVVEVK